MIPCGTILESAKLHRGMLTGLVVTSRITHATPGSFAAHVVNRDMENEIAVHELGDYPLGRTVDLMFGGGLCHFLGNATEGSCRMDTRDIWSEGPKYGWKKQIKTKAEFDALEIEANRLDLVSLPLMGLFTLDDIDILDVIFVI
ncbi:alkaline-phosphatase-like protein [Jimgerdemannia flammicorona]|uniref:alkaline phosphatase n=1 Tax=Jimgerdemannia flammicorona TaxID=994334 RepID=A0A433CXI6_9FUNG|nr:alkaline-phosphatase-like protein [Jimgerdemannia flammicorona]